MILALSNKSPREHVTHVYYLGSTMRLTDHAIDQLVDRSLNLISPIYRYLFKFLDHDRARGDDESHRLVQHQEHWNTGTKQLRKAFTPLREWTPYLDTFSHRRFTSSIGLPGHIRLNDVSLHTREPVTRCTDTKESATSHRFIRKHSAILPN